jgi:hypothetical protein
MRLIPGKTGSGRTIPFNAQIEASWFSVSYLSVLLMCLLFISCESNQKDMKKIIFLHHSTGKNIWMGETNKYINKLTQKSDVRDYFNNYNKKNKSDFLIEEQIFPKENPYGWKNYPYDYYNIWVKNAGGEPYMTEPTLEILSKEYEVIIFKHCYPVSKILADTGFPDINSEEKRIENYKLQYIAIRNKLHQFPNNKFIVWTPAVCIKNQLTEDEAKRTQEFHRWMTDEWDETGDNIFIWDFYRYETEGGLYLLDKYAVGASNSHPNREFSGKVAPLFCKFIIDVINGAVK